MVMMPNKQNQHLKTENVIYMHSLSPKIIIELLIIIIIQDNLDERYVSHVTYN